ncbi:tetratricopeptide repeat-containing sensor histidine kinase [Kordia zhangzhouensis]|uniref:tetratricopeptide repeat-containing sensor histidine kinase n=1 Tax=Kordia zhangzhouensis TaxID=1620405 RepID=UPI00069BAC27|nr:sensor histidine kinase [Kordia zhangzhouensis]
MRTYILLFILAFSTLLSAQSNSFVEARTKEEAIVLFEEYEQKSEDFNDKRALDSMQVCLAKIEALLPIINDSLYNYRTDLVRGTVLTRDTKIDEAMKVLLKASQFFKLQQDFPYYYRSRYKIGICYYYGNRRKEAQELMLEVVANKHYVGENLATSALGNAGAVDIELGMIQDNDSFFVEAIKKFRKAIVLNKKNKNYTKLASNYSLLAESYNQLKERSKAIQLLDTAIYYATEDKNSVQKGFALIKKANILTNNKQYNLAKKMQDEAIKIYRDSDDSPSLMYAYVEKKRTLMKMGSYEAASKLGDSIFSLAIRNYDKRFAEGIAEMETKYKTAEKEREILEQRAEIAEKGLLLQKRQYQIYAVLALAVLLSILGYVFYNQQKLKNRQLIKENKLKVALQEIETQNKLQEQRLRISRDLHDNIGAQLSFIISSIDNLKYASKEASDEFKDKLSYISEFTSATIDQLRDTIWAMNKDEISLTDLQSRTLAFIEKAKVATKDVKFIFNNEVTTPIQFTAIQGMHLFRVIQEGINNALKYANAKTITIDFEKREKQLLVSIQDDGIGFNKEQVQLGNGLYNMQKRMDEIDANITINSEPNQGTNIQVMYNT